MASDPPFSPPPTSTSAGPFAAHSPFTVPETEFDYLGAFDRGEITGTELGAFLSGKRVGIAEAELDFDERLAQERAEFNSYAAADLEVRFDALRSAADALISMLDATVSPAGPGRYELPSGRLNRAVNRYRKARRALDVD